MAFFYVDKGPQGHHGLSRFRCIQIRWGYQSKIEQGQKYGRGLYLFITRGNGATWRVKYRLEGKEKVYSIGTFPQNSLAQARLELNAIKACLVKGQDPVVSRRLNRANAASQSDSTFKVVAEEWFNMKEKEWSSTRLTKSKWAFERDVMPLTE